MVQTCLVQDPAQIRDYIARNLRGRYEAGPTMGQEWMLSLSEYVRSLPDTDVRVVRLANMRHTPTATGFMYEVYGPPHEWKAPVDTSMWLDAFVDWADSLESKEYGGQPSDGPESTT